MGIELQEKIAYLRHYGREFEVSLASGLWKLSSQGEGTVFTTPSAQMLDVYLSGCLRMAEKN